MTDTYDLVVAGAGGGLMAALRAADHGLQVAVVDADEHFARGNNTAMCTSMIPGVGTRWQRAAGVLDDADLFVADVTAKSNGTADVRLARALAEASGPMLEWLADALDLPLTLAVDVPYPGHSVARCHTVASRHGSELLGHLLRRVQRHPNIDLVVPLAVEEATPLDDDHIRITVRAPGQQAEELDAGALLLATNGFGADPDLVRRTIPEMAEVHYHGGAYSRGDALRIGERLQAATAFLDAYQGHAALSPVSHTLVGWAVALHGGIIVDPQGRRIGPESLGYSEFAAMLAEAGGTGWMIFDERIERLCAGFTDFQQVAECGGIVRADDTAALAAVIGVPVATLDDEIRAVQEAGRGEAADRLGRTDLSEALEPPFLAARVIPALFHTQGGLVVDENAQVLDRDAAPIPCLYASGGAAAGISGHGAAGYLAGNGLLPALGLAWLAAGHLIDHSTDAHV